VNLRYPKFLKDHHALAFVCDSIRMASSGGGEPFDADHMIENDRDVHHHEAALPTGALSTVAIHFLASASWRRYWVW
jgi:chemotaxis protein MotA